MTNPYRIFSLSIIGVFVFVFLPLSSVEAASVSAEERCSRLEGTDRYDRCVERVNKHAERKAKRTELREQCGELEGDARRECAQGYREANMSPEKQEFKAKIEAACGEKPARDADQSVKQTHRECAQAKAQELKDAGEFVPNKHGKGRRGKGHAFGRRGQGQNQGQGFGIGRGRGRGQSRGPGFSQNLPADVQSQIDALMEQIRALIEQNQQ